MRAAFAETLYQEALRDDRTYIVVADISPAGSMAKFRDEFPDRFINCGVAEQSMIGVAAGLALKGKRVFCYSIANFALYRSFEFVRNDLCYQNLPVTVVGMGAGVSYADHGATHWTMEDVAIASAIPNMQVIAPCDPSETIAATRWCARESKGPVYLRLGKAGEPDLPVENWHDRDPLPWAFGQPRQLLVGRDQTVILSYGSITQLACRLARRFFDSGEAVGVFSYHTLKPLLCVDDFLAEFKRVIVIEEHVALGGLGMQVKAINSDRGGRYVQSFTLRDAFVSRNGTREDMLKAHGLDLETIWEKVKP